MRNPITNIVSKNQSDMIPGSHPLADNTPVSDDRAGIGRPDHGNNLVKSAPLNRAKLLKFVAERCAGRTHKRVHNGIKNEPPEKRADDNWKRGIVHNTRRPFSVRAYLRLKLVEPLIILFLRFAILCLHVRYFFSKLFFHLQNLLLEFRYCVLVFIHNLILYYRNSNDGDEPPNVQSSGTAAERDVERKNDNE